jgi:hypothetical protein
VARNNLTLPRLETVPSTQGHRNPCGKSFKRIISKAHLDNYTNRAELSVPYIYFLL